MLKVLREVAELKAKSQVPSEPKAPKVLKELKDLNRRFRDMLVALVLKVPKDTLELKVEFKVMWDLKELKGLKGPKEHKVP